MKVNEDSLTSLLPTPGLRAELALLVALCTDELRRNVLGNFPEATTATAHHPSSSSIGLIDDNLIDLTADDSTESLTAAADYRRRQRDENLASPEMQELKRATLKFFDAWRLGVLRRLGEVLSVGPQDIRQRRADYNAKAKGEADEQLLGIGDASRSGLSTVAVVPTSLVKLDDAKRNKILLCLLLLTLSLEHYVAHSRILLQIIATSLHIPSSTLPELEATVSHGLLSTAANMSAKESTKKEADNNAVGRRWKVGLATVAGAALIGVTGGLAAPFLAAGIGTVMGGLGLSIPLIGGYLGALAGSSILIGGLFGSYGGRMTGKMMEKYAKEVEDFSFLPLKGDLGQKGEIESASALGEAEQSNHKLRVAIGISGWLVNDSDMTAPWQVFDSSTIEPFALQWEVESLKALGISISKVLKSYAWSAAKLELVRRTIFASLFAGLWPLGLLRIARVLDNPYSVAKARSDKAGRVLAHALMQKVQGERPVTLVGYSLGARVIFQAMLTLAEEDAFGLVESIVLIGAPVSVEDSSWRKIRAVVAGRAVNVYSQEDYILGFLYRTSTLQSGVAGLQAVEDVYGVENHDITDLMAGKGHASYRVICGQILRQIGFDDIDLAEVEKEEAAMIKVQRDNLEEDLIATDDLLGATQLSDQDVKEQVRAMPDERTPFQQNPIPNAPEEAKGTSLIECDNDPPEPGTPVTEDEESDEDINGRIAMVDLDPEPIL
ncbi:MAG: hypothetical protein LQ346_008722 [Caloplaca aetnensis]|nr:MAG: hypothetical protein LQ346_008722 [Caloplaca aetnensis]